jgi:DNA helicase TIP49 (TBP-interacting protein)
MSTRSLKTRMNFETMSQAEVPQGRNGKHKTIVTQILSDLDRVGKGIALKIPLEELTESKEKVRSALNRATRKANRTVATASDANFLYVWTE